MPVDNGSFHLSPRAKSHILVCHLWSLTPEHQELMIKKQLDPFKICVKWFSVEEKVLGLLSAHYIGAGKLLTEPVN